MPRIILGSISMCTNNPDKDSIRISAHNNQLRWLESLNLYDYRYYRIEQAYTPEFKMSVNTSIEKFVPLSFEKGLGPSGARNELLKLLYESDADWLVCMDDDRSLYSHYASGEFIEELQSSPYFHKLAERGVLITTLVPEIHPFKKMNLDFGMIETNWNLIKGSLDGCLQICCIPNLVKFGYRPVWFDSTNLVTHGKPPEDVQFEIDWLVAKHEIANNAMAVVKDHAPQNKNASAVFENLEIRGEIEKTQAPAVEEYVRKVTKNRCLNRTQLNKQKNSFKNTAIPRLKRYTPVQTDYGKYYTIPSLNIVE